MMQLERHPPGRPLVERVVGWSATHRKSAMFGWLVLVALTAALGNMLGGSGQKPNYDPGQAGRAEQMIDRAGGNTRPPRENVLVQRGSHAVPGEPAALRPDPVLRSAVSAVAAALHRTQGVAGVTTPLSHGGQGLLSADGRSALVTFTLTGPGHGWDNASATLGAVRRAVASAQAGHPLVRMSEAGDASIQQAIDNSTGKDFRRAELSSVPLTLAILVLVFGALVAAGIPVLLAVSSVIAALGLMTAAGRWVPVTSTASSVVLLVGLAVGVDYALFYLRREREERAAGRSTEQALRITARTSGRAIAVSGLTVMASLGGLFLTGIDVFKGMAFGTIAVVGLAVLGSVTVLPALLAMLGHRVDRARVPWLGRRRTVATESRFWAAVARRVVRRPVLAGGAAAALLVLLALPATGLRLADPSPQNLLPASVPAISALARIEAAFPGAPAPAEVVVTGDIAQPAVARALTALHRQAAASGGAIGEPISTASVAGGKAMIVSVPLAGRGDDAASIRALGVLRGQALPATLGRVSGISYAVGGDTAGNHDFDSALRGRTPIVLAFVLGLAFLLLATAFRSIAVPVASVLLNLLSIGAACGVVTWIFQDGHLGSMLGFSSYGGIVGWLPLFMFVILFGLSMDYHVFVLSRIRELRQGGESARSAIVGGISSSAGVVTSAAAIMVAVFSVFATLSMIEFKMLGVGMAVAIALDATIVRGILLPAALALFGERVWRSRLAGPAAAAPAAAPAPVPEPAAAPRFTL
jgi:RND superfamily putative drug exporter